MSDTTVFPANMRRWPNVGALLAYCLRRWPNGKPTLRQCLMFAVFLNLLHCLYDFICFINISKSGIVTERDVVITQLL